MSDYTSALGSNADLLGSGFTAGKFKSALGGNGKRLGSSYVTVEEEREGVEAVEAAAGEEGGEHAVAGRATGSAVAGG